MKPRHYYNRTYRENFWFFLGWEPEKAEKYLQEFTKDTSSLNLGAVAGKCLEWSGNKGGRFIAVWVRYTPRSRSFYPTLAHECIHAAGMCLSHRGIQPSFHNDEPVAYLAEDLMRFALEKSRG